MTYLHKINKVFLILLFINPDHHLHHLYCCKSPVIPHPMRVLLDINTETSELIVGLIIPVWMLCCRWENVKGMFSNNTQTGCGIQIITDGIKRWRENIPYQYTTSSSTFNCWCTAGELHKFMLLMIWIWCFSSSVLLTLCPLLLVTDRRETQRWCSPSPLRLSMLFTNVLVFQIHGADVPIEEAKGGGGGEEGSGTPCSSYSTSSSSIKSS